jgi:hypothetical protein
MRSNKNSLVVPRVPIDTLRLAELAVLENPKKQVETAQKFLEAFNQVPAVYAAPDGEILFWEEIWLALKANGATEVDAVIVNDKSPAELKANATGRDAVLLETGEPFNALAQRRLAAPSEASHGA